MPLTPQERDRVRYHTGHPSVMNGSSLAFGIAAPVTTLFLVEDAMNLVMEIALPNVRRILQTMDLIECKLVQALDQLSVEKLGDITLRGAKMGETVTDMLEREYARWGLRLLDILRVPAYPFSQRFAAATAIVGGSIPVRR